MEKHVLLSRNQQNTVLTLCVAHRQYDHLAVCNRPYTCKLA